MRTKCSSFAWYFSPNPLRPDGYGNKVTDFISYFPLCVLYYNNRASWKWSSPLIAYASRHVFHLTFLSFSHANKHKLLLEKTVDREKGKADAKRLVILWTLVWNGSLLAGHHPRSGFSGQAECSSCRCVIFFSLLLTGNERWRNTHKYLAALTHEGQKWYIF